MSTELITPHGGELVINMVSTSERATLQELAHGLPKITVGSRHLADLEMLSNGAYSPLTGFMTHDDYLSVVATMHLSNGLPWSIPITLAVTTEVAAGIQEGSQVALVDAEDTLQARCYALCRTT